MDRLTLLSMQGGLLLFMGLVVYMAWRAQKRTTSDRGPVWFAVGFAIGGIGLLLQAYRGIIPAFFAIILGNGLFLMTYVLMEKAVAITTRRRSYMYWLAAIDAAVILSYGYFTYVKPDVIVRTIEAVVVMPLMQLPIWFHLVRCEEKTIRPALRAMSMVLAAHMLMNFARVVGVVMLQKEDAWFTWFGVVSIAGLSVSFMWIDWLRVRDELERQALTDPLTGLLNRRGLEDVVRRELSRSARAGAACSALTIDVNKFKQINDTYGHAAGDKALCAVANALTKTLRTADVATRVGGDEFFVLLPDSDESAAAGVMARLRRTIEHTSIESADGRIFQISVSIGAVTSHGDKATVDELFHSSDMKLYDEKQSGSSRLKQTAQVMSESSDSGVVHLSNA